MFFLVTAFSQFFKKKRTQAFANERKKNVSLFNYFCYYYFVFVIAQLVSELLIYIAKMCLISIANCMLALRQQSNFFKN